MPTAERLRELCLASTPARERLCSLFDPDTFVELGAFTKRAYCDLYATDKTEEFEGVICGYGAIGGSRVFAFAEDPSRMKGAVDSRHAKKICDLYNLALKTGAPVIGIFDSAGADMYEGIEALAGYAALMRTVHEASGVIPQIAVIGGLCTGSLAVLAAMYDFVITPSDSAFYVNASESEKEAISALTVDSLSDALAKARTLVAFLPANASEPLYPEECADNLNRMLGELDFQGDAHAVLSAVADNMIYHEVSRGLAEEITTALLTVGGVRAGAIVSSFAKNEGRLTGEGARKAARFIDLCDAFGLPLITLVDSMGLSLADEKTNLSFAADLAKLASAYASAGVPKVTVIMGHAIGSAYVLLGSKALGADITYAVDNAQIGALPADAAVAFAWTDRISLSVSREDLVKEWKNTVASPAAAASVGEIDDIISVNELRQRLCSSLLLLSSKGSADTYRHAVRPL